MIVNDEIPCNFPAHTHLQAKINQLTRMLNVLENADYEFTIVFDKMEARVKQAELIIENLRWLVSNHEVTSKMVLQVLDGT